jgi:Na+/melibiose symporter-like transporter
MDIIAKGVPKTHLPTLWAWRRAVGGILGFGASVAAAFILSRRSGLSYPYNYAVLFALGAFFNGVGYFCFARVRERPEELPSRRASVRTYLRRGVVIFQRDRDYRRLYLFRVAWAGAIMSQAILVPFAVQRFGASPSETGGWFTAVILLVGGVSALVWGRGARIHGEVAILRTTSLAIMLCPLLALLLSLVAGKDGSGGWVEQMYLPFFMVMLAFSTIGINGFIVGWNTYLLALPPAQLRPSYLAFINTLTVPLLFAPALAGFIAEQFSYPAAFGISTVSALLAAVLAGSLHRRGEENHAITSISEADACTDA